MMYYHRFGNQPVLKVSRRDTVVHRALITVPILRLCKKVATQTMNSESPPDSEDLRLEYPSMAAPESQPYPKKLYLIQINPNQHRNDPQPFVMIS